MRIYSGWQIHRKVVQDLDISARWEDGLGDNRQGEIEACLELL